MASIFEDIKYSYINAIALTLRFFSTAPASERPIR